MVFAGFSKERILLVVSATLWLSSYMYSSSECEKKFCRETIIESFI
jgi:hypothetical protein